MNLKYYQQLDGIRGLAALMIMLFHFFNDIKENEINTTLQIVKKISIFGQTGVTLFFVLSGFLITRILIYQKDKPSYFKNFYYRRSLRIFPLYYFFLILTTIVLPLIFTSKISLENSWTFWVYLQNFAFTFNWPNQGPTHFWSLAVEEHFYLLWPLIVYFISVKFLKIFIYILCLLALFLRIYLISKGYGTFYFTFTNMDCLAIGGFLAIIENEKTINLKILSKICLIFITILILTWVFTTGKGINLIQYIKLPAIAIFYMTVIGISISTDNKFVLLLKNKALSFTGKISYGLYVYHPLCFWAVNSLFSFNVILQLIFSFVFSYIIATLSYYCIEQYFIKLKSRYT